MTKRPQAPRGYETANSCDIPWPTATEAQAEADILNVEIPTRFFEVRQIGAAFYTTQTKWLSPVVTVPTAAEARYHQRYVTVSPDFKIEEACRGMRGCQEAEDAAEARGAFWAAEEYGRYVDDWQSIAISWASR